MIQSSIGTLLADPGRFHDGRGRGCRAWRRCVEGWL